MFSSSPNLMEANISVPQTPSFTGWNDYTHDEFSSSPSLCTFADREEEQILDIPNSESWTEQDPFVIPEIEYGGVLAGKWNPCTGDLSIGKHIESMDTPLSYRSLAFRWEQLGRPHLEHLRIPLDLLSRSGEGPSAVRRDLSEIADLQEAILIQKLGSGKDEYNNFSDSVQLFVGFASYLDIYCAVNAELTALEHNLSIGEQSSTYQETFHRFLRQIEQDRVVCAQNCPHRCLGYLLWGEVYTWSLEEKHLRFEAYRNRSRDRLSSSGSNLDNSTAFSITSSPTFCVTREWMGSQGPTSASLVRCPSIDSLLSGGPFSLEDIDKRSLQEHSQTDEQFSDHSHSLMSRLHSPVISTTIQESKTSGKRSYFDLHPFTETGNRTSYMRQLDSPSLESVDSASDQKSGNFGRRKISRPERQSLQNRPILTKSYTADMIREGSVLSPWKRRRGEHSRYHSSGGDRTRNNHWLDTDDSCESETGHIRYRTKTESEVDHRLKLAEYYEAMYEKAVEKLDVAVRLLHMEGKLGNRNPGNQSSTSLRGEDW